MYNPQKSIEKGAITAGQTGLGGTVATLLLAAAEIARGGSVESALATGGLGAIITLGGAALSGLQEWRRNRKKHNKPRVKRSRNVPNVFRVLLIGGLSVAALSGCMTTTTLPDGSVVREYDDVATRDALAAAYVAAVQAYEFWAQIEADRARVDEADYQRELERRAARLNEIRRLFEDNGWLVPLVDTAP